MILLLNNQKYFNFYICYTQRLVYDHYTYSIQDLQINSPYLIIQQNDIYYRSFKVFKVRNSMNKVQLFSVFEAPIFSDIL